jgi:DNA topoisomerase-2
MKISDFFNSDYVNYSSYDNLRKIASIVDGQKNASRKVLYTILEKNIKEKIKVSQLGSKVAEFAEYLHGNLDGVIVNLAQDFPGTNNIPLLQKKGNFGTRFSQEASASRYIYAYGTDEFFKLFRKDDVPVLKHQTFEGEPIEPMFYVPTLPILLINGSEGVSSGFAQKILPRNPSDIKTYIKGALLGKQSKNPLVPYYAGFKGTIEPGDSPSQWLIKGSIKRAGVNKVEITEVPVGYDLKTYIAVLDDLEERKVIQSYRDKSEGGDFLFEVTIPSKTLQEYDDDELMSKLKLIKKVTENYTVIDENNKIAVFDSARDILNKYIEIKKHYLAERKTHLINKTTEEIRVDYSRYLFIKLITEGKLKINKRKKDDIVADLDKIEHIIQKDGSYDYLLRLPIINMTVEELAKLENRIKESKDKLDLLINTSPTELWLKEL